MALPQANVQHLVDLSKELADICHPLCSLNVSHFTYIRNFRDGTQINLSNQPKWIDDYYNLELYKTSLYDNLTKDMSKFSLWPLNKETSTLKVYQHGKISYNSHYGITFSQTCENEKELYFFSSSIDNPNILEFYLNNLDLLQYFIFYFKEKAEFLLEKAFFSKIKLCRQSHCSIHHREHLSFNRQLRKEFLEKTVCHRIIISNHPQKNILSKKELDCINYFIQGKTAKQTGETLHLSQRTVESHLENARSKLSCKTKIELVSHLFRKGLFPQ